MKKYWRITKAFLTFEFFLDYKYLYLRFKKKHENSRQNFPQWPIEATRRILINDFWLFATIHYSTLVGIVISGLFIFTAVSLGHLGVLILICIVIYLPIYAFLYRPMFTGVFLVHLEVVISNFEERGRFWMERCKQDQLSNRAIVLLMYVWDKSANLNYLTPSDKVAHVLQRIFGVSSKGLKNELDLIYKREKRAKISQRQALEIRKSFEEAYEVLESMQYVEGINHLRKIEQSF